MSRLIGKQTESGFLSENQIREIVRQGIENASVAGKRVLAIIPDTTRTAPMPLLFRLLCQSIQPEKTQLNFLIALGTHPQISEEEVLRHVGISREEKEKKYGHIHLYCHEWNQPEHLTTIGTISSAVIENISQGLLREDIPVSINKRILDYDLLLVVGPVFPHEVVGFSGGNKYFFPGIAGADVINSTHWLGALITNIKVNGVKETPIRKAIDFAASFIPNEKKAFCFVATHDGLKGLFFGSPKQAWSEAADLSAKVHVVYSDRTYRKVIGIAPRMYDDLWVAGKVMYKLESIVEDGGELVIYAPNISEVSYTHGKMIEQVGYHVRDYFLKQMYRFQDIPKAVLAHSTHVRGTGTFENGVEHPRIQVTLSTQIPEQRCRKINLGYLSPDEMDVDAFKNREDESILVVPEAGETLYKLK
jgi:nickel-dependent lactate racemase